MLRLLLVSPTSLIISNDVVCVLFDGVLLIGVGCSTSMAPLHEPPKPVSYRLTIMAYKGLQSPRWSLFGIVVIQ